MKKIFFLFLLFPSYLFAQNKDLDDAIVKGDVESAKKAIEKAKVNKSDKNGNPALVAAGWYPEIIKALIAAKADVNQFSASKVMNPLIYAASWGEVETMKLLIDAGADVNIKDVNGNTPLFWAAFQGCSAPAVKLLLEHGADPKIKNAFNMNALTYMAFTGKGPVKKTELQNANVPFYQQVGITIPAKYLDRNWYSRPEDIIELLVNAGCGINEEDVLVVPPSVPNSGKLNTGAKLLKLRSFPLYAAMDNVFDRAVMVKALLAKGADPKKEFGASFLNFGLLHVIAMKTASNKNSTEETVKALADAGIDLNKRDIQGYTPLMKAAIENNIEEAKALIEKGADVNVVEKQVDTDYSDFMSNTMTVTKTWRTALDWASELNRTEIYQLILKAGGKGAIDVRK